MPTYLITSQEVKDNTKLGGNVDSDRIMPLIYDQQVMVLENVLGTKLYDYIITNYQTPLTGLYLQMYDDYIKPVLWHSVYADYVREGNTLAQNGGIYTNEPQNASPTDLDQIKYVAKGSQSKADVYIDRLTRFLCDQEDNIPEYTQNQDNDYDIDPQYDINTVSGWYFGGGRKQRKGYSSGGGNNGDYLELE